MQQAQDQTQELKDEIIELVVARLQALPEDIFISIGSQGEYKVSELIDRVKQKDEIGKIMVDIDLNYLRSLKDLSRELANEDE